MRPSSSGMVLALTIVPGILESFLIIQLKTIFPMSRLTRKLHKHKEEWFQHIVCKLCRLHNVKIRVNFSPNGDNLREEQQEAKDLEVPTAGEVLQSYHDQGDHHQGPKQDLGQTVHLQVEQTHLTWPPENHISPLLYFLKIFLLQNNCVYVAAS